MNRIILSRLLGLKIVFFISAALLSLSAPAAVAYVRRATDATARPTQPDVPSPTQQSRQPRGRNLTLRPEAYKLSRRLGLRFKEAGREVSVLTGTLTYGGGSQRIAVRRIQGESGESLEVVLGGGATTHTWDDRGGARQSGRAAEGEERRIIERLALDSPDQFVLAQLRGASYYTVARGVRPEEAGGSDVYTGPSWDLVRVSEPEDAGENRPQSLWRIYYVNSSTGLIDRVASREQDETVTAEMSGWVVQGGETVPSSVVWKRSGQTVMELSLSSVSHGPTQ